MMKIMRLLCCLLFRGDKRIKYPIKAVYASYERKSDAHTKTSKLTRTEDKRPHDAQNVLDLRTNAPMKSSKRTRTEDRPPHKKAQSVLELRADTHALANVVHLLRDRQAVDPRFAGRRCVQAGQHVDRGRLAGTWITFKI